MVLGCYGRKLVIYWQVDGWARGGSRSVTSCYNLPSLPVPQEADNFAELLQSLPKRFPAPSSALPRLFFGNTNVNKIFPSLKFFKSSVLPSRVF